MEVGADRWTIMCHLVIMPSRVIACQTIVAGPPLTRRHPCPLRPHRRRTSIESTHAKSFTILGLPKKMTSAAGTMYRIAFGPTSPIDASYAITTYNDETSIETETERWKTSAKRSGGTGR